MEWISDSVFYICITAIIIQFLRCLHVEWKNDD